MVQERLFVVVVVCLSALIVGTDLGCLVRIEIATISTTDELRHATIITANLRSCTMGAR